MKFKILILGIMIALTTACATPLNSIRNREYATFERKNVLVEEKKPVLGAVLGILPGGGSFYAGEYTTGVIDLLTWPLSVLWDPVNGYQASKTFNYDETVLIQKSKKEKELVALEDELATDQIDNTEYIIEKRKLDKKYDI